MAKCFWLSSFPGFVKQRPCRSLPRKKATVETGLLARNFGRGGEKKTKKGKACLSRTASAFPRSHSQQGPGRPGDLRPSPGHLAGQSVSPALKHSKWRQRQPLKTAIHHITPLLKALPWLLKALGIKPKVTPTHVLSSPHTTSPFAYSLWPCTVPAHGHSAYGAAESLK